MANVNLIDSSNIEVKQNGSNISLDLGSEVVVDSIRSKNLYNKNSTYVTGGNNQNISNVTLLKPNTNYYFKSGKSYTGVVLYDSNGTQTRSLGGGSSTTIEIGFTTQSNEVKAILTFYSGQSNVDISTFDFTGIQLEEGTTATTYAPYQNLTGQEFYSKGEIKIGTWIDGKPLYRKVIVLSSITVGSVVNQTLESLNITNVSDIFVNVSKSFVKNTSNEIRPLPGAINTSNINYVYCTNTRLYRYCTDNSLNGTWNICLEYTKSTD